VAIDLVAALWSMSFKKSHKHWGALQHVGVNRHYKENMLNLDIMIDHNFKYRNAISMMPFVQTLPGK
jgi:hypothetical protein